MKIAIVGAVFETLTEIAADGTLRGELATGWRSNADGTRWTFDLRQNVRFHDGSLFTAADVITSYDRAGNCSLPDVARIEALGVHEVLIELQAGDPHLPLRLSAPSMVILPLGDDPTRERGIHDPLLTGTGLYQLHRFEPGRQFIGNRVANHYKDGAAGWFDSVEIVSIPSDAVRAEALREHYVDAVDLTHTADLGNLENITLLPKEDFMSAAVDSSIALPAQIGTQWPLDNLRAPQRWWKV